MDSLFHFIFAFIGGMAIGLHKKHSIHILAILAFSAVLIDIDHWISYGIFHNIFITVLLPLVLFLLAYNFEKKNSIKFQSIFLILLVMLTGHLMADLFYGDFIKPFYPLSGFIIQLESSYFAVLKGTVISGDGVAIAVYSLIILLGKFTENFIYFFEKKHNQFKDAFRKGVLDNV